MKNYMAPMEGVTNWVYRNAYHECFYPMDKYFTPFITAKPNKRLSSKEIKEVSPDTNGKLPVVPQILTNNAEDFVKTAHIFRDEYGHKEVNLNLGCPSGTVTAKENKDWQVIALLSDDSGIPKNAADRLRVFDKIMAKAKEYGISPSRIHIDPLVEMLCTSENGIETNIEVISTVREKYPSIHITAAISNISFNLPVRKLINLGFVVLAMNAGLDSGILDPTNRDMLGLIYATEALLGEDDYCMEYIGAYREGLIGPVKK